MANLNKCSFIGRLTRDPEVRVTPKGASVCQFGIAVNREWKEENGTKREETTFLDVEAWAKTGELCDKFLRKGSEVYIDGRLRQENWEDKTSGQKRSKLKIVLENVQFLGRKPGEETATPAEPAAKKDDDEVPY